MGCLKGPRRSTKSSKTMTYCCLFSDGEEEGAGLSEHRLAGLTGGNPGSEVSEAFVFKFMHM